VSPESLQAAVADARRIVVKVGSSSISGPNVGQIEPLVDALAAAHERGAEVVLVSSGAIATGIPYLQLDGRPTDLATQQAAAAVGQNILIYRYQESLRRYAIVAGQVLLTAGDLENPTHRSNAQRAMERLLKLRIMPIVNENDTVATHEIRFGDNDRLAALVSELIGADLLVLLSDVDALYTKPPQEPGAEPIGFVAADDDLAGVEIGQMVFDWEPTLTSAAELITSPRGTDARLDENRRATRNQRREEYHARMDAKAAARAELDAEREAGLWADDPADDTADDDEYGDASVNGDVEVQNPEEGR
jgi:glutamate 5-kinase